MKNDAQSSVAALPTTTTQRPLTVDDVQRIIGALTIENERLRRENEDLREQLLKGASHAAT